MTGTTRAPIGAPPLAPLGVVLIEDEPVLRRELGRICGQIEGVQVIGEAAGLADAERLLARLAPDVILLDVRLGRESGLALLPHVDPTTAVILVTAHAEFAAAAYEHDAVDYIVKPVRRERLAQAFDRAVRRLRPGSSSALPPAPPAVPAPAFLVETPEDGRAELIRPDEILMISADGDYSEVVVVGRPPSRRRVRRSLREWLERLDPAVFRRVHRQHVVNLRQVTRIVPWSHRSFQLHLNGLAEPVAVSRRAAAMLRKHLR